MYSVLWWIELILIVSGGLGILTVFLNLFFFVGDNPKKRWVSFSPKVGSPDFLAALARVAHMPLEYGGEIKILNNGMEFLPAFLNAMRNAKKSINITTFVWDDGKMSNVIFRILIEQSEKGVEVRILLDGVAGLRTPISKILELKNAGGRFEMFRPPRFGKLTRLHRRNHRRGLVIEGEVALSVGKAVCDY